MGDATPDEHVDKKRKVTPASKSATPDRKDAPASQDKDSTRPKPRARRPCDLPRTRKLRTSNGESKQGDSKNGPTKNGETTDISPRAVPLPKSPTPTKDTPKPGNAPDTNAETVETHSEPELPPTPVQLGLEPRPVPGARISSSLGAHMSSSPSKRKAREKGRVGSTSRRNGSSLGNHDRKSASKDIVSGPVEPPARVVQVLTDEERVKAAESRRAKREDDFNGSGPSNSERKTLKDYLVLSRRVLELLPFPLAEQS